MSHCAYGDGDTPFKTKKAFKDAVAAGDPVVIHDCAAPWLGPKPDVMVRDALAAPERAGVYYVEGPDPLGGVPNKWYAQVTINASGKVTIK